MRWSELFEDDQVPRPKPAKPRDPGREPTGQQSPAIMPQTEEPIVGVPADEVEAWIETWDTEHELPEPKARAIGIAWRLGSSSAQLFSN